MFKKFLLLISLLFIIPAYAGELDSALKTGEDVFLYLYTDPCKYCILFSPRYERIKNLYPNDYKYIKINADTTYGQSLIKQLNVSYVPFVLLINASNKKAMHIPPSCLLDNLCTDNKIKAFKK